MTNRSKIILFTSILLSLSVIAGIVLNLVNTNIPSNQNMIIFYAILILISISSIPFIYWTKIKKNKYEKLLDKEYLIEYEIIKDLVMNSILSTSTKNDINEDVLDLLLSAQKTKKPVKEVVGISKRFAEDIIKEYSNLKGHSVSILVDGILYFTFFVLGSYLFLWLEEIENNFFETKLDISMLLFFIIIAFILIPIMRRNIFKNNSWTYILPLAFGISFVLLSEILRYFAYSNDLVKVLLDGEVRIIPNIMILMLFVLVIPVALLLKLYSRKRYLGKISN